MVFDAFFEIGLLVLGLLYVGDMYFNSIIDLISVTKDIECDEEEKQHDRQLEKLSKHMYC